MATVIVTESNLEEIKASDKTVLLDFYADWCVPCKRLGPVLEDISEENPDIIVGKINVEDEPDIAEEFGIMSVPTLIVLKYGDEADKAVGFRTKAQILDLLD
ncbi:MAG: thioredoxin [Lachnospiraceae bacterium]|nr:thioredoxin [Lachnospiraceae bacterium]SDJ39727.1 thioredoxin [Lachnospiraceae bacterium G41]